MRTMGHRIGSQRYKGPHNFELNPSDRFLSTLLYACLLWLLLPVLRILSFISFLLKYTIFFNFSRWLAWCALLRLLWSQYQDYVSRRNGLFKLKSSRFNTIYRSRVFCWRANRFFFVQHHVFLLSYIRNFSYQNIWYSSLSSDVCYLHLLLKVHQCLVLKCSLCIASPLSF